jgi:predicted transcriptional regulator
MVRAVIDAPVSDHLQREPATVTPDLSVRELAERFANEAITWAPVLQAGKLVGVVSDKDLVLQEVGGDELHLPFAIPFLGDPIYLTGARRFEAAFRKAFGSTVGDLMTRDVISIREDRTVHEAARLLVDKDVPRLPVVDGSGGLLGAIGRSEIVRALASLEFE